MFGSYRRGDANDPDTYVAAVAAVLAQFSEEIIREVTDPRTGISQSDYDGGKFQSYMPNSGELKAYCKAIEAHHERIRRYQALPRADFKRLPVPRDVRPGRRANLFVGMDKPRYAEMVERAQTEDPADWRHDSERGGIWVPFNWWDQKPTKPRGFRQFSKDDLEAIYRKHDAAAE